MLPSKWEHLSRCSTRLMQKNYHFYWIIGRTNILCKNLKDTFSILGMVLRFLFYVILKVQLLVLKFFLSNFCCTVLLVSDQKECLKFLKSCFRLVILMVSILVDLFNLMMKKHQRWNLRHILVGKLLKFKLVKYWRKLPSLPKVRAPQSCS